jgi:hypothetical protein
MVSLASSLLFASAFDCLDCCVRGRRSYCVLLVLTFVWFSLCISFFACNESFLLCSTTLLRFCLFAACYVSIFVLPAEENLAKLHSQPGYSLLLLTLIQQPGVPRVILTAGAVNFKNFVQRNWNVAVRRFTSVHLLFCSKALLCSITANRVTIDIFTTEVGRRRRSGCRSRRNQETSRHAHAQYNGLCRAEAIVNRAWRH